MMRLLSLLVVLLISLSLGAQVRPDQFPEEASPTNDNFEVYSQKNGVARKATLAALRTYFGAQIITQANPPSLSGNLEILRNKFVDATSDGSLWFVDFQGNGRRIDAAGGGDVSSQVLADSLAGLRQEIPGSTSDLTNDSGFLVSEVDGSVTNELQVLSLSGSDLTLSDGGGTVTLTGGGASDGVVVSGSVSGNTLNLQRSIGGDINIDVTTLTESGSAVSGSPFVKFGGDRAVFLCGLVQQSNWGNALETDQIADGVPTGDTDSVFIFEHRKYGFAPLNTDNNQNEGPQVGWADALKAEVPYDTIGRIYVGGIHENGAPYVNFAVGTNNRKLAEFETFIAGVNALVYDGKIPTPVGYTVQGEANNADPVNDIRDFYIQTVLDYRKHVPGMPFVLSGIKATGNTNAALQAVTDSLDNVFYIDNTGRVTSDGTHYTWSAQRAIMEDVMRLLVDSVELVEVHSPINTSYYSQTKDVIRYDFEDIDEVRQYVSNWGLATGTIVNVGGSNRLALTGYTPGSFIGTNPYLGANVVFKEVPNSLNFDFTNVLRFSDIDNDVISYQLRLQNSGASSFSNYEIQYVGGSGWRVFSRIDGSGPQGNSGYFSLPVNNNNQDYYVRIVLDGHVVKIFVSDTPNIVGEDAADYSYTIPAPFRIHTPGRIGFAASNTNTTLDNVAIRYENFIPTAAGTTLQGGGSVNISGTASEGYTLSGGNTVTVNDPHFVIPGDSDGTFSFFVGGSVRRALLNVPSSPDSSVTHVLYNTATGGADLQIQENSNILNKMAYYENPTTTLDSIPLAFGQSAMVTFRPSDGRWLVRIHDVPTVNEVLTAGNVASTSLNMGGNLITQVATPTAGNHAVPDSYLQSEIAGFVDGIKATVTLDFASTNANSVQELTTSITGVSAGDLVLVTPLNAIVASEGVWSGYVSGTNTVNVKFVNDGSGVYDPPSSDYNIIVFKY